MTTCPVRKLWSDYPVRLRSIAPLFASIVYMIVLNFISTTVMYIFFSYFLHSGLLLFCAQLKSCTFLCWYTFLLMVRWANKKRYNYGFTEVLRHLIAISDWIQKIIILVMKTKNDSDKSYLVNLKLSMYVKALDNSFLAWVSWFPCYLS